MMLAAHIAASFYYHARGLGLWLILRVIQHGTPQRHGSSQRLGTAMSISAAWARLDIHLPHHKVSESVDILISCV